MTRRLSPAAPSPLLRRLGVAAAFAGAVCAPAHAAVSNLVKTPHVEARLVSQTTTAAPGSTVYVALHQSIIPGWHTYWRNPGDAGQATTLAWTLPAGWSAGDIVWPAPHRELSGPVMSYVYTGAVDLPVPVAVPASARAGQAAALAVTANWLVCKDVCIPESGQLTLRLPVSDAAAATEPQGGEAVAATLAAAPKPEGLDAHFKVSGDHVTLAVTGAPVTGVAAADAGHAYFFPYDTTAVEQAEPQTVARGPGGLSLTLPAGYAFTSGKPPARLAGVLTVGAHAFELEATAGAPAASAAGLGTPVRSTPDTAAASASTSSAGAPAPSAPAPTGSLLSAVALAFLGGMVLNLMPCVFPVLAMKAAALTRHLETPQHARREALGFLLGVVASLMTLAVVLIVARAGGQAIGWGFQMQSPPFVAALVVVTFLAGMNLSGVFEVGTSVQGLGAEAAARRGGLVGAVLTGVLAVVVAAPCSAPFMAGAMGWALAQPPAAALAVFLALALGLAAPFTALAFVPGLATRLPRPGGWMDVVKRVLAFPMYATAAWLAWVFALQAGVVALPFLFGAVLASAFAAWCWGAAQAARRPLWPRGFAMAALAGAVACLALAATAPAAEPGPASGQVSGALGHGASVVDGAQSWSPETVTSLRAAGHPVFVDFTAAWCVTCQVNERTALADPAVKAAFDRAGAVYLKADWTRRDARIAKALTDQGRSGVPLYLVYDTRGGAPVVLPQLLTPGAVSAAVLAAHA